MIDSYIITRAVLHGLRCIFLSAMWPGLECLAEVLVGVDLKHHCFERMKGIVWSNPDGIISEIEKRVGALFDLSGLREFDLTDCESK